MKVLRIDILLHILPLQLLLRIQIIDSKDNICQIQTLFSKIES